MIYICWNANFHVFSKRYMEGTLGIELWEGQRELAENADGKSWAPGLSLKPWDINWKATWEAKEMGSTPKTSDLEVMGKDWEGRRGLMGKREIQEQLAVSPNQSLRVEKGEKGQRCRSWQDGPLIGESAVLTDDSPLMSLK